MSDSATLYANETQTRFYLIPDDADVASGGLILRSLTGRRKDVDPDAARSFEVPEDRAKELAREEIGKVTRQASQFLSGVGSFLQDAAKKTKEQQEARKKRPNRAANVADALGVTPEQLQNDPDAVIQGLKGIWEGLQVSLADALKGDPASQEATRQRVEFIADLAGVDVGDANSTVDDLREKLHDVLSSPELEQRVRDATDKLNQVSSDLKASARGFTEEEPDEA